MVTYLDNFTRQSIAHREEISILGATLNDLAKEKECLQACLDKKSENIASLGESLAMKVCLWDLWFKTKTFGFESE